MFSGTALYMKTVLGVGISIIGMLEAVVEAIAYSIRIFSGAVSDFLRKRKSVMLFGFILLAVAKPLLAFSKNIFQIFIARTLDRVGNGIQASPRDALISDISPKGNKGACYGLRQSLSVVGSTLGGVFGIIVMKATGNNFKMMFLLASVPAFLAVLTIIYFVKEKKETGKVHGKERRPIKIQDLKALGSKFWMLIVIVSIFMLGRFSEVFISLNACEEHGLNVAYATLVTVIYNLASTLISYPAGKLSDGINRTTVLLIGFILLFLAHATIYVAPNIICVIIGTVLWGLQIGISQSIFSALISDYVPKDLRGTGFGVFYFVTAVFTAIASMLAGIVSEASGTETAAFFYGGIFALIASFMLLIFKSKLSD